MSVNWLGSAGRSVGPGSQKSPVIGLKQWPVGTQGSTGHLTFQLLTIEGCALRTAVHFCPSNMLERGTV